MPFPLQLTFGPKSDNFPKLIGIAGHAGSGKDSLANHLCDKYSDTYSRSLAYPLKQVCSVAFGIPDEHFSQREIKELINPSIGASPRELAQYVGTDMFRALNPDFWAWRLHQHLIGEDGEDVEYEKNDTVVIPDVRFQEEINYITNNGGIIIKLVRPGYNGQSVGIPDHPSENQSVLNFPGGKTYVIVNDGTLTDLYKKVAVLLVDLYASS